MKQIEISNSCFDLILICLICIAFDTCSISKSLERAYPDNSPSIDEKAAKIIDDVKEELEVGL